jgi:putative spermidine/putrescine transport system ATP-binding protein
MSAARGDAYVRVHRLTKQFGPVVAVEDVSFEVRRGEFLTLLGPSGSGKTTTLSIIAGFEQPTSGDVLIDGRSIKPVPPHKRNIGMVFQRYTLFPHMSVFDNVAFPLAVRRRPRAEITTAVEQVLSLVQLRNLAERKPNQLSGGQQQRVALARALVYRPGILLMDEPLGALDKKLREEIQIEIRRIHRQLAVTLLYVTHDQDEALRMSDRIAVFNHGRVVQVGTGEEIYDEPQTSFVGSFIGTSNFIDVTVVGAEQGMAMVRLADGNVVAVSQGERPAAGSSASLMIRPEKWRLTRRAPDADAGKPGCVLPVTLAEVTFLGDTVVYNVVTSWGQQFSVRDIIGPGGHERLAPDTAAFLSWRADDGRLFAAGDNA